MLSLRQTAQGIAVGWYHSGRLCELVGGVFGDGGGETGAARTLKPESKYSAHFSVIMLVTLPNS